jgi:hypothetical protein
VLDGKEVPAINSYLRAGSESPPAVALQANSSRCYRGNMINGAGFVLTPGERDHYIELDPANDRVIFPYLGGEEINSSPSHDFSRYVINFGKMTVDEAGRWPGLLQRVEELVKPGRFAIKDDTGKGGHGKKYWWQFLDRCDPLMEALTSTSRCLVSANVTKHLMFTWQPKDRVLSNTLFVFALDRSCQFACLQSRVHEGWARLHSSSMRTDLRYTPTDCFETFPFPQPDPRAVIPELEDIGERLYAARASYMLDATKEEGKDVGLTITYNRLKDPAVREARIVELRAMHEEMDRAVLRAYGWDDLAVPPFCLATDEDRRAMEGFEAVVIDRLFALNAERAKAERLAGMGDAKKAKGAKKAKKGDAGEGSGQGTLGGIG